MKILIIRLSSLGDVILSSFVVRLVRNAFPNSTVDFLVASEFAEVFKYNPRITNLIVYDKSKPFLYHICNTLSIINPKNYDVIIDLQNNLRSWVYSLGKSSTIFRFKKRRLFKLLTVTFKKRAGDIRPIPVLYANSFPTLERYDDGLGLELWTTKDISEYLPHNRNFNLNHIQRVAIAPGAKHFSKRLPLEKFIALVDLLQSNFSAEIYLIGGKEDQHICQSIAQRFRNVSNFAGKLSVVDTAELLDTVDFVISNDSSAVHIASARRRPVIQIFGSTVPEFGFIPFRTPFKIVENNSVNCRPCTHYGKSYCPKKHFRCMNEIAPEHIFDAVLELTKEIQQV